MSGGKLSPKDIPYATPKGPTDLMHKGPGLGGHNCGVVNQPYGNDGTSGSVGLGGTNHGTNGTQGRH